MKIPTNTKNTQSPYKKDIFDTYVTWKSIPACMRLKTGKKMAKVLTQDDELYAELLTIRNQSEFADKYNIENSTLSNWNKLIEKEDVLSEIRKWGQKYTSNMLFSLYQHALEKGNPKSFELWFQIVEGWSNKKGKGKPTEREFITIKDIDLTSPIQDQP